MPYRGMTNKEYMTKWYKKNRERELSKDRKYRKSKAYQKFKRDRISFSRGVIDHFKDQPCTDCGKKFPPECMDFDHIHGEKDMNVSRMLMQSIPQIINEILKCDLVCANCHRIRTKKENHETIPY